MTPHWSLHHTLFDTSRYKGNYNKFGGLTFIFLTPIFLSTKRIKSFFRLYGSYSAIQAGYIKNALVDLTGGITEEFNLRDEDKLPPDLWNILQRSHQLGSVMGCGIWVSDFHII